MSSMKILMTVTPEPLSPEVGMRTPLAGILALVRSLVASILRRGLPVAFATVTVGFIAATRAPHSCGYSSGLDVSAAPDSL